MLVLTRKEQETILIGNDIQVTVMEVKDGQVRLGIKAPKDVTIYRKELYEAIQKENKEAAGVRALEKLENIFPQMKK